LYTQTWSHRVIKPHETYSPPPLRTNPFSLDFSAFSDLLLKQECDLIHALIGPINLGGQWGEEICRRAHLSKIVSVKELTDIQLHTLFSILKDVLNDFVQGNFSPVIITEDNKKIDVLPLPLSLYDVGQMEKKQTFADAIAEYFHQVATPEESSELLSLYRIREQQENAIIQLQDSIRSLKHEGDLIYVHYGTCQEVLDSQKKEGIKKGGSVHITLSVNDPRGGEVEIRLDASKDVNENASAKYEKAKRLQGKLEGTVKALGLTRQQLRDFKENHRKQSAIKVKQVKKLWFEHYRWFISSEGNIVVGGKNAPSNDKIVKKYLAKGDRYVHANMKGAPSCVVKAQDAEGNPLPINETTLQEACQFAVVYSRAWNRYGEMDAYWVKPEQVSKSPPPGEYLPRGSFIITGKRHYHRCPMEHGLGIITLHDVPHIMGAPPSVVKKLKRYLLFIPGKQDKNMIANEISSRLHVPVETIQSVLPPGDIDILEDHL
jgi:predicted ribosome quality control (RQC) complex YloA/Tae2 family protein